MLFLIIVPLNWLVLNRGLVIEKVVLEKCLFGAINYKNVKIRNAADKMSPNVAFLCVTNC